MIKLKKKDFRPLRHLNQAECEKNETLAFEAKTGNNLALWCINFPKDESTWEVVLSWQHAEHITS